MPESFDGVNIVVGIPNATEDQYDEAPAYFGNDDKGNPFFLLKFKPSKEDLEAFARGDGFYVKVLGSILPPLAVLTFDYDNKPNI